MTIALFPGTFDPPTVGHLDLITRSSNLYEKVHVVVGFNMQKKSAFSVDERISMLKTMTEDLGNVEVHGWDGLLVDYARKVGARVLIRGIRGTTDFTFEFDLALLNKQLEPSLETVFLPTDVKNLLVKSSVVKELARFGGDFSSMVSPRVYPMIFQRLSTLREMTT